MTVGSRSEPVESYLAYLSALERSPNTQRAYATSLKLWFEFLRRVQKDWRQVDVNDVARFVSWLRAPAENVVVLGRWRLAALAGDGEPASGCGVRFVRASRPLRASMSPRVWWRGGGSGRGAYKPFLHHVTKGRPVPTRPVKLAVPKRAPRTLRPEELVAVLAAPDHARDRFLLALLAETGMRIGQALGLRHADFVSRAKQIHIVPRGDNANGARAKLRSAALIPVTAGLVRCYSDYMHAEYGEIDSDYVFVNLWSGRIGAPMTYSAVHDLVGQIRARTGVDFTLHMLRHTHATELVRSGMPIEVVARLLTHRSSATTSQTYVHLDVEDIRAALVRAGDMGRKAATLVTSSGAARHLRARPEIFSGGGEIEAEYASDIWHAARLGIRARRGRETARFEVIRQLWLREAIKRWCRFRLAAGYAFSTIDSGAQSLARFSLFSSSTPKSTASAGSPGSCWKSSSSGCPPRPSGGRPPAITRSPSSKWVPRLGTPTRHPARPARQRGLLRGRGEPTRRIRCHSSSPSTSWPSSSPRPTWPAAQPHRCATWWSC